MAAHRPACKQEHCKVGTEGRCLEGLPDYARTCQHYLGLQEVPAAALADSPREGEKTGPEYVDLPHGEALRADAAAEITTAHSTRLLFVIGDADSGKTTLLAELYAKFLKGPFAGYLCAGCNTFPGFERRCHLSRMSSGRVSADTQHTSPSDGYVFLHLSLRRQALDRPAQHVLFSDISGERLKLIRGDQEAAKQNIALRRADRVLILLDGEKLIDTQKRSPALQAGLDYVRSLHDYDLVAPQTPVSVLLNKWDKFEQTEGGESLAQEIQRRFREKFKNLPLQFHRVAARPNRTSSLPRLYGMDAILPSWVEEAHPRFRPEPAYWEEPDAASPVDRALRHQVPFLFSARKHS